MTVYRNQEDKKTTLDKTEDEDLFPVSPWKGPDTTCPKCGVSDRYYGRYHYKEGELAERKISKPKFCAPGQRVVVGRHYLLFKKRCKHPGNHLHQECKDCGAHFVSLPKHSLEEDL